MIEEPLRHHLSKFRAAPFLFVGAGLSRRYLNLDGWEALLRRMAELTGKDFAYYSASANGDLPTIASLIAEDLHEIWWSEDRFQSSRDHFQDQLSARDSALKAEVSLYLVESMKQLPTKGAMFEEIELLRKVVVDGIITTNFDPLLEHLFPDLRVFVGQEELLFEDPQGVGELYKIHGSHEKPDSLVLTRKDYDRFAEQNPYLAAKLMTTFVERPVVFLGYSLTDHNVAAILHSIVSCLHTQDRVAKLADRLIFVQWNPDVSEATMANGIVPVDGNPIPVLVVTVPDYSEVLAVLGSLRRGFSAKLLRQLKEQVYELVLEGDPKGRLHVLPLDDDTDISKVDLVFGVGAIAQLRSYAGLSREDLADDVLDDGADYNAIRVVHEALPGILSHPGNVPIYKYLRQAALLTGEGELIDPKAVDRKIASHAAKRPSRLGVTGSYSKPATAALKKYARNFDALAAGEEPGSVLQYIPAFADEEIDPGALRRFLLKNEHLRDHDFHRSQWIKMTCLYDWLVHGRQIQAKPRRGRKPERKGRAKS